MRFVLTSAVIAMAALLGIQPAAAQQACPIKLGIVLPVTGPNGSIGQPIADTALWAVEQVNAAGGVHGCQVEPLLRDTQGQASVGVDAAKNLVDVEGVPALIGAVSSGVTLPILTSVAVPAGVVVVTCCSSSPTFTELAQNGETNGLFFRTLPTSRVQAVAVAKLARDREYEKTAVIYVNNDYGVNMAKEFEAAFAAFGGEVSVMVPYNESQTSYRAEVNQAMAVEPDSLFFISYPADGATLMREWFSFGGTDNIILSNALRADEFVSAIGGRFLSKAVGIDNAQVEHPSVDAFNSEFEAKFGKPPQGPGLHLIYDAVVVTLLAMQSAETVTGLTIRDNIRVITSPDGTQVFPGVDGLTQALNLIKDGQTIRYVGATGPLQFDENGDVAGPVLVWGVDGDTLVERDVMTIDDMNALFAELEAK